MKTTFLARVTWAHALGSNWEFEVNHLELWFTDPDSTLIMLDESLVGEIFQITIEDQVVTYLWPLSQLDQLPDGYYEFTEVAGGKRILEVSGEYGYVHGALSMSDEKRAYSLADLEELRRAYELTPLVPVPPKEVD